MKTSGGRKEAGEGQEPGEWKGLKSGWCNTNKPSTSGREVQLEVHVDACTYVFIYVCSYISVRIQYMCECSEMMIYEKWSSGVIGVTD